MSIEAEVEYVIPQPQLQVSNSTDAAVKAIKDEEYKTIFSQEVKDWNKDKKDLKAAMVKAYGLIWSDYTSQSMQDKIEQHPDYATTIKKNPIELLKAIKKMMHETTRNQYEVKNND